MYLAGAMVAALAGGCARRPGPARSAPNVLLVTIDTLRADRVGALGSTSGATPNLDRLAARGVVFEKAFTTAPLTVPAHASLLSGRWPFRHGMRVNGTDRLGPDVPLVPEAFRAAGGATAAVVGSLVLRSPVGLGRGFDVYDESFAENAGRSADAWKAERRADEVADRALAWLESRRGSRFLLWVHFYDPHAPYEPPAPTRGRFASPYDGEVAAADAALGRLLDRLEKNGLLATTLVVVAGDHGESLGEHGEETHGVFVYDATIRVPLVLVPPGGSAARRVASPVSLVDVAPTVRELAALAPDPSSDGVSLVPLLSGAEGPPRAVYAESVYPAALLGWSPLRAARSADAKFVEAPRREYYDLVRDPGETLNLAAGGGDESRDLARRLALLFRPGGTRASLSPDEATVRGLASLGYVTPSLAEADLDRIDATRTDPKDRIGAWPRIERAIIARQLGRPEEAADLLSSLDPSVLRGDPALLRELALVLRRSRRLEAAARAYEDVLRRFPPVPEDWFGLGVVRHLQGRARDAARAHEEAVRMRPGWADARINLGQEYLATGRPGQARDAFAEVVRRDPKSVDGLSGLAAAALAERDLAAAADLLRQALAADPGRPETLENLARVERALGNTQEAERLMRARDELLRDTRRKPS